LQSVKTKNSAKIPEVSKEFHLRGELIGKLGGFTIHLIRKNNLFGVIPFVNLNVKSDMKVGFELPMTLSTIYKFKHFKQIGRIWPAR
jgi:hypothetical protein